MWLRALSRTLQRSGGFTDIVECQDSRQVLGILAKRQADLILLDLTMPHLPGDELLPLLVEQYPEIPVIINTALNQVETAVQCMQLGAFDFLVKTSEEGPLLAGIQRALRFLELQGENRALQQQVLHEELRTPEAFSRIHTQNPRMLALFRYLEAVAPSGQPVLITGESGAGKELLAKAVHLLSRKEEPWVPVNVAGLDDNVFSDTLFGHVRGAFTGADQHRAGMIEQAAAGTLFLDEIGDLSPLSQVKLLRLLQEGEYLPLGSDKPKRCRARIVVATNQDLELLQKQGRFRKDLYYRLRGHHAQVPPLRQRRDDLPLLLECFLTEASEELGKKDPTPPPELLALLGSYHFPGNVRELRAMVYDAVSLHEAGKLSMAAFKKAMGESNGRVEKSDAEETVASATCSFPPRLPSIEEAVSQLVDEAMRRAQGNQGIAAGMLGISRQALSKRLKKSASSS